MVPETECSGCVCDRDSDAIAVLSACEIFTTAGLYQSGIYVCVCLCEGHMSHISMNRVKTVVCMCVVMPFTEYSAERTIIFNVRTILIIMKIKIQTTDND